MSEEPFTEEVTSFAVSIDSRVDEKGHYTVQLSWPGGEVDMTYKLAISWARHVLSACAAAEYDATVLKQLSQLDGITEVMASHVVMEMREDRQAFVPDPILRGLALVPGVSHRSKEGFLAIVKDGEPIGQWDLEDGRKHALTMLEAMEVAPLDGAYYRTLLKTEVDPPLARMIVSDLAAYRPKDSSQYIAEPVLKQEGDED